MRRRLAYAFAPVALCLALAACGGGGGSSYTNSGSSGNSGNSGGTPPPPPALSITTTTLPSGVAGTAYSATLQATGGTGAYTWKAGSNFPSWLSINGQTGAITGTLPVPNPAYQNNYYSLTVVVSDSATPAHSAQAFLNIAVAGVITVQNMNPSAGTINVPYSWSSEILGGRSPYTVTVDSGLPPGLQCSIDTNRQLTITGTPTQTGTFTAQVHVKDSVQDVAVPLSFSFDSKFAVFGMALKTGVVGRPYSAQVTAVNGTPPYMYSAQGLPSALVMDPATGQISGTVSMVFSQGTFGGWFVTVKDSSSPPQTLTTAGSVGFNPPLMFVTSSPLQGNVNSVVDERLLIPGGIYPTTVTASGTLPPGLTVDSWGTLGGTPTQTGTYAFTVSATDSDTPPVTIQNAYTFTVYTPLPVMSNLALPAAVLNRPYSAKLWARSGTLPYTWSVAGGQLPPGLSLDADGNITGTPTTLPANGAFSFSAAVTDSASPPQTAKNYYSIAVTAKPKGRNDTIANATPVSYPGLDASFSPFADPPDSTTSAPDTDYYRVIATAGSVVTVSASAASQTDPALEIVDANGQRYKTCKDPGDDNPTLSYIVKDTTPDAFDDDCLNDDVDPTVNRNASLQFQVPGATGTQLTFYVHVFESSGNARPDMTYHLDVSSNVVRPLQIDAVQAPPAKVGTLYSVQVQFWASGGTPPNQWQLASGTLPPGIQLVNDPQAGWMMKGTPTTAGTYNFTLQVTDSANPAQTDTAPFAITVQ